MFAAFTRSVVSVSIGLALAAGCTSSGDGSGKVRSSKAVGTMVQTRSELATSSRQVDEALASMGAIRGSTDGDLRPAFERYNKAVADVEKQSTTIRENASDMVARSADYRMQWQQEMQQVQSSDLRESAEQRSDRVNQRYEAIDQKYRDLQTAYEPFVQQLRDVQTYLRNDLTTAGVRGAQPAFSEAQERGQSLKEAINALAAELDDATAALSPTGSTPVRK